MVGRKDDQEKMRWTLVPWQSMIEVVKVLEYGARKYGDNNWVKVPKAETRYFNAMMRHMIAWNQGERTDPETGLSHLAHAGCCMLFLLWFEILDWKPS